MKNFTEYIFESDFENNAKKCKTFGELFCLYNGIDELSDFDSNDYDTNNTADMFNRENMEFIHFLAWTGSVYNEPISEPVIRNHKTVNFIIKSTGEKFSLDCSSAD